MITKQYAAFLDRTDRRYEYVYQNISNKCHDYDGQHYYILRYLFANPAATSEIIRAELKKVYSSDRKIYLVDKSRFSANVHLSLDNLAEFYEYVDMSIVSLNSAFDLEDFENPEFDWDINTILNNNPNAPAQLDGQVFYSNPNVSDYHLMQCKNDQLISDILGYTNKITWSGIEWLHEQKFPFNQSDIDKIISTILTTKTLNAAAGMFGTDAIYQSETSLHASKIPLQYYMPQLILQNRDRFAPHFDSHKTMLSNPINQLEEILKLPRNFHMWDDIARNPSVDVKKLYDQKILTIQQCYLNPNISPEFIDVMLDKLENKNELLANQFGYTMYRYADDVANDKFQTSFEMPKKFIKLPSELQEKIASYMPSDFYLDYQKYNANLRKKHRCIESEISIVSAIKPCYYPYNGQPILPEMMTPGTNFMTR